ncbi:hypothetical protein V6N13_043531 [Hibiscus sabdariffa]
MPQEPVNGIKDAVNYAALERYKWFISGVRSNGMNVMLALFHHSLPSWAAGFYGINYYGQEVVSGAGLKLVETDEYSESG